LNLETEVWLMAMDEKDLKPADLDPDQELGETPEEETAEEADESEEEEAPEKEKTEEEKTEEEKEAEIAAGFRGKPRDR
jgi:hypothetical protein